MRRFSVFKRKKSKYFYCQLKNPRTGKYLPARSTRQTTRDEAVYVAMDWLKNGIPDKNSGRRPPRNLFAVNEALDTLKDTADLTQEDATRIVELLKRRGLLKEATFKDTGPSLVSWLTDFWTYDSSPYVKDKLSHGHKITRGHVNIMKHYVKMYWSPFFADLPRSELTREKLNEFSAYLSTLHKRKSNGERTDELLSAQSKNHILKSGTTALNWAFNNNLITQNPAAGLMKFSGDRKPRGILTDTEIKKLFSIEWRGNPSNRIGNILAMETGLRRGEIVALQVQDVGEDRLFIRHSWNDTDGLKSTKTGEEREIPLLPETRSMLLDHAKFNPHGYGPASFVFWNPDSPEKPFSGNNLTNSLVRALEDSGMEKTERLSRGICFHSWRHYYSKKMADALSERAMRLTGHKTAKVFEAYAGHRDAEDFRRAAEATAEVFGRILPFEEAK